MRWLASCTLILAICLWGAADSAATGYLGVWGGASANDLLGADGASCVRAHAAAGGAMRLRGGSSTAVAPLVKEHETGLWKGRNIFPKKKRIMRMQMAAVASTKVQARFVIDCGRPSADSLLDVGDLEQFIKDEIKVQGKRGNIGPRRRKEPQDRIQVFTEKMTRVVVQSYIHLSKRYVKWLVKRYLYKQGMRNFLWCVRGSSKHSYQLRYYNFEDLKSTAAAESIAITQEVGGDDEEGGEDGEGEEEEEELEGDNDELKDVEGEAEE